MNTTTTTTQPILNGTGGSNLYRFGDLPMNRTVVSAVNKGCELLASRLPGLRVNELPISDYNRRYFGRYLEKLRPAFQTYSHLLVWGLGHCEAGLSKSVIVDYGAGSGFLSLLAKAAGVGTVIYNDIYDVSCQDAKVIAEALGLAAEAYVEGEISVVKRLLAQRNLACDAIISMDVIEHIYDIRGFLDELAGIGGSRLAVIMASSANTLNPRTRRLTMKLHRRQELTDRPAQWGAKQRDTRRSFLSVRREMIREKFPKLEDVVVEDLARRTRGRRREDIEAAVGDFVRTGVRPAPLDHPTNTCDPYTGNWSENLMDPYDLGRHLAKQGFQVHVKPGYYGAYTQGAKQWVASGLDCFIRLLPGLGLKAAPYYIIYGRRSA